LKCNGKTFSIGNYTISGADARRTTNPQNAFMKNVELTIVYLKHKNISTKY